MEYTWRVWKNNRFAGYVRASSEWEAVKSAQEKFGSSYILVERMWEPQCVILAP